MPKRSETMVANFKGVHFPSEVILKGIGWSLAYPLSSCHVEEFLKKRGANPPVTG
jgi:transposase-like protein